MGAVARLGDRQAGVGVTDVVGHEVVGVALCAVTHRRVVVRVPTEHEHHAVDQHRRVEITELTATA